jgi:ACT domain-containing protein
MATREEVETLVVTHILDGEIAGTIDQVAGCLQLNVGCVRYAAPRL